MEWTPGAKVKHRLLPGTYVVLGSPQINEIGYRLVPVLTEKMEQVYLHPDELIVSRTLGRAKPPRPREAGVQKEDMKMSVCLDRFAYGLPDPQEYEAEPVATCATCGEEFYPGDVAIELPNGDYCCPSASCLAEWVGADRRVL